MKFDQIVILLPCLSLEDFSLRRTPEEAEQLLSAWTALWHPDLLQNVQAVPIWLPAEQPPQQPAGQLVVVPDCSVESVPPEWFDEAAAAGACVIRDLQHREQFVAAALKPIGAAGDRHDPELVADFHAVGFGYLVVELLTRQLRYMSNLDEESFKSEMLKAAEEAAGGNVKASRDRLQSACDLLHEAREYFYPVEAHLIDLTLVAPTTMGPALREELAKTGPSNLLLSGEVLEQMAQREPASLTALREGLEKQTAGILGGNYREQPLPLMPPEAIRRDLKRGLAVYERLLGQRPKVFARRRFGLSPVLPQILRELGFTGVLHATLDDGRFPVGNQSRLQWEGLDSTAIEALARVPVDIGRADTFLRLPERLGESMDLDHVATMVLAHWPGQSSPWYEDLQRMGKFSSVAGRFATIDDYFDQTSYAGQQTRYEVDQYRSPYLNQAVASGQADPISRWVRYYARCAMAEATSALRTLAGLVAGTSPSAQDSDESAGGESLLERIDGAVDAADDPGPKLDEQLGVGLREAVERYGSSLAGAGESDERAVLLANPTSFSRRLCLELPSATHCPAAAGAVVASAPGNKANTLVVDVPPMGFAWLGPDSSPARAAEANQAKPRRQSRWRKPPEEPPMAEENILRNEFCKIVLDPHTGAIRGIADYHTRGARLAQQIALRQPHPGGGDPGGDVHYSIMAADEISVTSAGPVLGEIVCRGRLVSREGKRVAGFRQATRVWRGSRVIEVQIDLDPETVPGGSPWNSYYAARFAWSDATTNLYRSVSMANVPTSAAQLEAPHFVDLRAGNIRTTLLTGGLPYHRRFGLRKLDTLLAVRGETAQSFRLGIGIDLPHPMPAALAFIAPQAMQLGARRPPVGSGWLFHLDCRNVVATHWEPLPGDPENGLGYGFRTRLLETDSRHVRANLRAFRPVATARRLRPGDQEPTELEVKDDRITVELGPHAWVDLEARFSP